MTQEFIVSGMMCHGHTLQERKYVVRWYEYRLGIISWNLHTAYRRTLLADSGIVYHMHTVHLDGNSTSEKSILMNRKTIRRQSIYRQYKFPSIYDGTFRQQALLINLQVNSSTETGHQKCGTRRHLRLRVICRQSSPSPSCN